jgi:uncharacterized protein with GYD domain
MPHYVVLGRLTPQAKRNPVESMKARDQLFEEFRKKGLKITAYLTLGPYDVVNVVEAPSEELMMKFLLSAGQQGNIETTTLPAFTQEDSDRFRRP